MFEHKHQQLLKNFYDAASDGQWDKIGDFMPEDAINHTPLQGRTGKGLADIKAEFQELVKAFPDFKIEASDICVEGDKATARITISGTHKGEFAGIPPTGKRITVGGIDYVHIKHDKLAERWGYYDQMQMMQQLGVMPG